MSAGRAVAVTRLTLTDFRNYRFLRMEADPRPVVLSGANGAGKTNVLEALSFLTPGRGLRRAKLSEVTRRDAGPDAAWGIAAAVEGPNGTVEIGTGRLPGSERRAVRLDGQAAKGQSALAEVVSAIWLTPAMDRLFQEGAAGRRRFLDRLTLGFDPAHAGRAGGYEHGLRERARLLRAGRADPGWAARLEAEMARLGVAMAVARRQTVERLQAAGAGGGAFPTAALALAGIETWLDEMAPEAAEERLRQALAAGRRLDAETGGACEGPHRSDLKVRHLAKDMPAEQCSTGEQKALLVSIVLAQARAQAALRGQAPVLLLDEVAAHLDAERRAALFDEIAAMAAQSWLTGTDAAQFDGLGERAQYFRVHDGSVVRM